MFGQEREQGSGRGLELGFKARAGTRVKSKVRMSGSDFGGQEFGGQEVEAQNLGVSIRAHQRRSFFRLPDT